MLNERGILVIVITNQSGVARGKYSLQDVALLHRQAQLDLASIGARIDAFMVAPWHPNHHATLPKSLLNQRKPGADLFKAALGNFMIDPTSSVAIGDKVSDVQPGIELGMAGVLIRSRYVADDDLDWAAAKGVLVVDSLFEAVRHILERGPKES